MLDKPYDVFISHAGEDKHTIAIPLCKLLQSYNISVFLDIAELRVGEHAPDHMIRAMETAHIGVFVLSPEFAAKKWPMFELMCFLRRHAEALENGDPPPLLIPIFYRLGVSECGDSRLFGLCGEDGGNVFVSCGFFERARALETGVMNVLNSLAGIAKHTGIENTEDATNEQASKQAAKRGRILDRACEAIVRAVDRCVEQGIIYSDVQELSPGESVSKRLHRDRFSGSQFHLYWLGTRIFKFVLVMTLFLLSAWAGLSHMRRDAKGIEAIAARYERAIKEERDPSAMNNLGQLLLHGDYNQPPDFQRAVALFEQSIEEGRNVEAMFNLGRLLENGAPGVEQDHNRASTLYNHAIREGESVEAMYRLANLLWYKNETLTSDPVRSAALYERAIAERGHVSAMINLGVLLAYGAEDVTPDPPRAVDLYERAIKEGRRVQAMNNLAMILARGMRGVRPDPIRAMALYERAIKESTSRFARSATKNNLGVLLERGAVGVKSDPARARTLYEEAINEGRNLNAMYHLGVLLWHGAEGVEQDRPRAKAILHKGVTEGHALCRQVLSKFMEKETWSFNFDLFGASGIRLVVGIAGGAIGYPFLSGQRLQMTGPVSLGIRERVLFERWDSNSSLFPSFLSDLRK